jgi:hypothetical protein
VPLTLVQGSGAGAWGSSTVGTGGGSQTPTWGASRTAGGLLLLIVSSDVVESTPTGWTLAVRQTNNGDLGLWYRIADNTSTDAPTVPSSGFPRSIAWAEYSGNTATPLDKTASGGTSSNATTLATGTTAATTQADELAVAVWGYAADTGRFPGGGGNVWSGQTNSFTELFDIGSTSATVDNPGICVATKALAATGTQTSTATNGISGGGRRARP